jgi:hypothetical protein
MQPQRHSDTVCKATTQGTSATITQREFLTLIDIILYRKAGVCGLRWLSVSARANSQRSPLRLLPRKKTDPEAVASMKIYVAWDEKIHDGEKRLDGTETTAHMDGHRVRRSLAPIELLRQGWW